MQALAGTSADWPRVFDEAARLSPEAGVALYSLGDPDLLAAATRELVDLLQGWALLGREAVVLDLGCGIGRVAAAVAPHVTRVVALDISPEMRGLRRNARAPAATSRWCWAAARLSRFSPMRVSISYWR
jgi:SAM-dependent methyltransferase